VSNTKDKPKNPNERRFLPKAGPHSMGYKRRTRGPARAGLLTERQLPWREQRAADERKAAADLVLEELEPRLRPYKEVANALEVMLDCYVRGPGHGVRKSPLDFALSELYKRFGTSLTPGQLALAKRAFREELALHL
jgi:hypothetical protein